MERFSNVNLVERFANVNRYYDLVSKMHDHKRKAVDVKEWEENYFKPGFKIFKILPKVIKAIDGYYGPDTFATSLAKRTKLLYRDKLVYDLAAFGLFERANEVIDNLDMYSFFKESIDINNMRAFITEYADFSELAINYIIDSPEQAYKKDIINYTAFLNCPTYIQQYFFRSSKLITKVKNSDRYTLISEKDIEEYKKRKEKKRSDY
ncbi:MAG TPA: hypothetical protein DCM73_04425 [Clostridiales bacterium]|nr:hypothetical protein [Clostridiales bacterium]